MFAQCADGQISFSMNVYTDPWAYECYWELVPGTNECGDGTIAWGSNLEAVGCNGGGEQNAYGTDTSYPSNAVVVVDDICLNDGEYYTLYFVDDWGDGGLYFEMFADNAFFGFLAGSGIGNSWTFQAGFSYVGEHDSPCSALEVIPGAASAVELTNVNCYAQVAEAQPPQGNCNAMGVWCPDEVNHTVWAKFTVPDDGAYEISTVNNGTIINTQLGVWLAEDCGDLSSFIYISGNDNFIGEDNVLNCAANPPPCVDQASAAYLNVLNTYPECCANGWDDACQTLYDELNSTCAILPQTCDFILEGYDSYGDGWNGCYVIVTIDGVSQEYSLSEGNYALWSLPVISGSQVSIEFVAVEWPEEVYISLKNPDGVPYFFVQAITVDPLLFDDAVSCNGFAWHNPESSRCYTNCLPAGQVCYIQIDGYDSQMGQIILTVKPYDQPGMVNPEIVDVVCPVGVGSIPEGIILPNITGWGLNYYTSWSGPDDFTSDAYFLENIPPGEYIYHAEDLCGNFIDEVFVVEGPQPFALTGSAVPSCPENADGSVTFTAQGGTEPYEFAWMYPDSSMHAGTSQNNLQPGLYSLILEDAMGCLISLPLIVEEYPTPIFSLGQDLEMCQDFDLLLNGPPGMDYLWMDGSTYQSIVLNDEAFDLGQHDVELTVTNAFGCSFSDEISLVVNECVGLSESRFESIHIYPNPTDFFLNVEKLPLDAESLEIFDLTGRLIFQKNIRSKQTTRLDVSSLASGNYVVTITADSSKSHFHFNIR